MAAFEVSHYGPYTLAYELPTINRLCISSTTTVISKEEKRKHLGGNWETDVVNLLFRMIYAFVLKELFSFYRGLSTEDAIFSFCGV